MRPHAALLGGCDEAGWLWSGKHKAQAQRQAIIQGWSLREVKGLLYLLTHLSPRMCLDLGKFELSVVGVHLSDLLPGWGAENLDGTEQKNRAQHYVLTMNFYSFVEEKHTP